MKKKQVQKQNGKPAACRPVRIDYSGPEARRVCIAGNFNNWQPQASPMIALGAGHWAKELTLAPGVYEYRFVVDGNWVSDPRAKDSVPNPYGSTNALLKVGEAAK
jgi:1,4-alpha-glucan branching enzyme